jgi:hypothetical protein
VKRGRTVLPLPRYTRREFLQGCGSWSYYFSPPSWALTPRKGDDRGECLVGSEALGTDYTAAVARVEKVLLPLFDSWRTRGLVDLAAETAPRGSFDWLLAVYRESDEYKRLGRKVRRLHEAGFGLVGNYLLKDGRRFGALPLSAIDKTVTKPLYANLARFFETDPDGRPVRDKAGNLKFELARGADGQPLRDEEGAPVFVERRTTANHAMKSCRRAWNVALDLHPREVPTVNPFAKLGLRSSERETRTADYDDLLAALAEADAQGLPSMAAALLVPGSGCSARSTSSPSSSLSTTGPSTGRTRCSSSTPRTAATIGCRSSSSMRRAARKSRCFPSSWRAWTRSSAIASATGSSSCATGSTGAPRRRSLGRRPPACRPRQRRGFCS